MTPRTRRARLLKLADYLAALPKGRKFDMNTWGRHKGKHPPEQDNFCGTTACALGHAAMISSFRRAGLKLEWDEVRDCNEAGVAVPTGEFVATVTFAGYTDGGAGRKFFGLDCFEVRDVFHTTSRNRADTIKKLRQLAAKQVTQNELDEAL